MVKGGRVGEGGRSGGRVAEKPGRADGAGDEQCRAGERTRSAVADAGDGGVARAAGGDGVARAAEGDGLARAAEISAVWRCFSPPMASGVAV